MSARSGLLGCALRGLLVALGAAGALATAEGAMRLVGAEEPELNPLVAPVLAERGIANDDALAEQARRAAERWKVTLVLDPEIGARPVLGDEFYSAHGTVVNDYPFERRAGVARLLFLGDSVTRRGHLIDALRVLHPGDDVEWWNAGVEGFGTRQEALYYARFNRALEPDHIVLTVHNNDLLPTPVVFFDERGRLVVFRAGGATMRPNELLLRHSRLYRRWLRTRAASGDGGALAREVATALAQLSELAREDGARLSAILLPVLAPEETWTQEQRDSRATMLALLADAGVETFDLLEPLRDALRDGIDPCETPGDVAHPSPAVCAVFARDLVERGLLSR